MEAAEAAEAARERLRDMFLRPAYTDSVLVARACLGLSQEDVAQVAGVSRDTVRRVERGAPVRSTSLLRVVRALGDVARERGICGATDVLRLTEPAAVGPADA